MDSRKEIAEQVEARNVLKNGWDAFPWDKARYLAAPFPTDKHCLPVLEGFESKNNGEGLLALALACFCCEVCKFYEENA